MTIERMYNLRPVNAILGIEYEIETVDEDVSPPPIPHWNSVRDGSIGEGWEFVSLPFTNIQMVKQGLATLENIVKEDGLIITDRCSIHIHINVLNMSFQSVMRYIILYILFEKLLLNFCGDSRTDNMFCIPVATSGEFISGIINSNSISGFNTTNPEIFKYGALNVCPIRTKGTLEFRSLQTTKDFSKILLWIDILLSLKTSSGDFSSNIDMVDVISNIGPVQFLNSIFSNDMVDALTNIRNIYEILDSGLECAMDVAHNTDGTEYVHRENSSRHSEPPSANWRSENIFSIDAQEPPRMSRSEFSSIVNASTTIQTQDTSYTRTLRNMRNT